ncbi:MAG: hypothetical protein M0Z60_01285 [Nitrospiraceae bacterium]|nr:hypothetical protein [Nitrospiraceae bacterium]
MRECLRARAGRFVTETTAVFVGHEHLYLRSTIDGVTEIITGGGGATLYAGEGKGRFYHFLLITVSGDG